MSRWLLFPSPASSAPRLSVTGLIGSPNGDSTRYGITSWTKSGDDSADYLEYSFFPIRNGGTFVLIIVGLNASGTWANVGDWKTAITIDSSTSSLSIGGAALAHTSVTYGGADAGTAAFVMFNASSGTISTFWNAISTSDDFDMQFNYTT